MPPKYHGAVFQSAGQLAVFKAKTPTTSTLRIPKNAFEFMSHPAVVIPEKLFFKIGEVCELAGVQAHVLRYWESEFPMLSPQKNNSGQRSYRRRDVEIALRIKQLLYDEMFTIAGAKKKLQGEMR